MDNREYVAVTGVERPTDATYILQDSLHPELREFLIEGDGWRRINKLHLQPFEHAVIYEGSPDYDELHEIYLTCDEYELVR